MVSHEDVPSHCSNESVRVSISQGGPRRRDKRTQTEGPIPYKLIPITFDPDRMKVHRVRRDDRVASTIEYIPTPVCLLQSLQG